MDAWRELCDEYGKALYVYAYHRCAGDRGVAQDVRQETLLAAADGIRSYAGRVPLFHWLCGIARRKVADEMRRRSTTESILGAEAMAVDYPEAIVGGADPVARGRSPDELFEEAQVRARVIEALWSLPVDYRTALIMRYVDESGVDVVASKLGRTYKGTESLLSRARAALREALSDVLPGLGQGGGPGAGD